MANRSCMALFAAISVLVFAPLCASAGDDPSIEGLMKAGWDIAGFTTMYDNRSALILFRHPKETYLVQCRTGLDVTRKPPVYANCYELR